MAKQIVNTNPVLNFDLGIAVQKGIVEDFSGVQKFGYNPTVGGSFETIWDGANNYTYIATAGTATVTSSNSASDDGGTVEIQGLDANYNLQTVDATIGGSATTETFIRVFRARLKTANTGDTNVGDITVTVDSKSSAIITAGRGQTLMALYTVPANKRAYILQIDAGSKKDLEHELKLVTREIDNGNVFNTKAYMTLRGEFIEKNYRVPILVSEKTDIEIKGSASATSAISAGFEFFLEDYD